MADIKALAEELVNLTVKDVQELANVLKEEYGIEPAAAAVAVAAGPAAAGEAAAETIGNVIIRSDALIKEHKPDIVVTDVRMPPGFSDCLPLGWSSPVVSVTATTISCWPCRVSGSVMSAVNAV